MDDNKECEVCGRKNPLKGANYCYYCGASFREADFKPEALKKESDSVTAEVKKEENTFSMWKWLALFALLLLPPYGWIIFVVILCINAFGTKATEERRAFSKAFLLFILAAILVLYLFSLYIQSNPDLVAQYNEMLQRYQGAMQ